ncbi:MAG: hypothetical protein WC959_09040 [Kiritimatiellales bacterium]
MNMNAALHLPLCKKIRVSGVFAVFTARLWRAFAAFAAFFQKATLRIQPVRACIVVGQTFLSALRRQECLRHICRSVVAGKQLCFLWL